MAMTWKARFSWRLPPRLRRIRKGLARAGRDRGDAGQGRQGVGGAEPPNVADLADELGGHQRTNPGQTEERMALHEARDPGGERSLLETERPQPRQPAPGELGLDTGQRSEEPADQALMAGGDEVARPAPVPRHQAPQVGVEPIADASHLDDDVLAGLDQELEIERSIGKPDRGQVMLAGRHPGDRHGITRIALAEPPRPDPLPSSELRRHLADGNPGADEGARRGRPKVAEPSIPTTIAGSLSRIHSRRRRWPAGSLANVASATQCRGRRRGRPRASPCGCRSRSRSFPSSTAADTMASGQAGSSASR